MISLVRPLIAQQGSQFTVAIAAANSPVPINGAMQITAQVDSFLLCNYSTNANSVFFGMDSGVTVNNGIEILTGTTIAFIIDHEGRQIYELQGLQAEIAAALTCRQMQLDAIPFVVWDMSQVYVTAAAATNIGCVVFKSIYH